MLPGRRVEDDLARRQRARSLAVQDHPGRRAVLDRAAGVLPLGLGVERHARRDLLLEPAEAQQRRVADQSIDGVENAAFCRGHVEGHNSDRESLLSYRGINEPQESANRHEMTSGARTIR